MAAARRACLSRSTGSKRSGCMALAGADVGDDDSGLLVEICGGVAPLGA